MRRSITHKTRADNAREHCARFRDHLVPAVGPQPYQDARSRAARPATTYALDWVNPSTGVASVDREARERLQRGAARCWCRRRRRREELVLFADGCTIPMANRRPRKGPVPQKWRPRRTHRLRRLMRDNGRKAPPAASPSTPFDVRRAGGRRRAGRAVFYTCDAALGAEAGRSFRVRRTDGRRGIVSLPLGRSDSSRLRSSREQSSSASGRAAWILRSAQSSAAGSSTTRRRGDGVLLLACHAMLDSTAFGFLLRLKYEPLLRPTCISAPDDYLLQATTIARRLCSPCST